MQQVKYCYDLVTKAFEFDLGDAGNKWENGNSNPDIGLLSPIARLLNISLDTRLSFHEKLTDAEIEEIIRKMDRMFSEEGYHPSLWTVRGANSFYHDDYLCKITLRKLQATKSRLQVYS